MADGFFVQMEDYNRLLRAEADLAKARAAAEIWAGIANDNHSAAECYKAERDAARADLSEARRQIQALRERLQERLVMAREVLDQEGYENVAALVPLEEVLIWMDEIGDTDG